MTRPIFSFALTTAMSGLLLGSVAQAQDIGMPTGYISVGAAYSERYGETAYLNISEDNFLGSDVGINIAAEYNRSGYRLSASLDTDYSPKIPGVTTTSYLDLSAYVDSHTWQGAAYNGKRIGANADLVFPVRDGLTLAVGYFIYDDTISDVAPDTSPLVAAEAGQKLTSGVQVSLYRDTTDVPLRPTRGTTLSLGAQYAGIGGDTNWAALTASGAVYTPLATNGVASAKFTAGHVRSLDGNAQRITERAFLGNDLPRGFAFGGLGPRDVSGATDTSLGGETYVATTLETNFAVMETITGTIHAGAFWEAGSVWNLQETSGGAMGEIDDTLHWRASYGVSISWVGNSSQLRLSWADAYKREVYDVTQPISLTFETSF